eukprot:12360773-Alexandrium_andersonii.AAC.1
MARTKLRYHCASMTTVTAVCSCLRAPRPQDSGRLEGTWLSNDYHHALVACAYFHSARHAMACWLC